MTASDEERHENLARDFASAIESGLEANRRLYLAYKDLRDREIRDVAGIIDVLEQSAKDSMGELVKLIKLIAAARAVRNCSGKTDDGRRA
jgi:hypothetical protein